MNKQAQVRLSRMQLYVWSRQLLFAGPTLDAKLHRHHAAQLAVGLRGPLRLRLEHDAEPQDVAACYLPPDVPHGLQSSIGPCAILYLDPESRLCMQACQRFTDARGQAMPVPEDLPGRLEAALVNQQGEEAVALLMNELFGLQGEDLPRQRDRRLERVLDWIDTTLPASIQLASLCRECGVSASWLTHHFGRDLGIPLRRYLVWRRLRLAMFSAVQGHSLTEAAYLAGFADAAHLSRSFADAFGVAPSFLVSGRVSLDVSFMD